MQSLLFKKHNNFPGFLPPLLTLCLGLSSSYSTAALEFEQEHQIAAVYESPRMSRRSLRLQTGAGHYASENVADYSLSQSTTRRETR